ncbi:hypothetical protein EYB53_001425 [Candidatus Chloroploca sp. M-50]|uniref:Uncharacterized protein n=1 Tax=Candidatus Chloroploca mongolica TaxID=2528176 RepID=A0ABS4D4J2_9CHLR|nr:hypothetical protein [Candidatus Chloroploca mongolica]MBP1464356.1 hypothetical protein [Candidatus Chloroploca mongolica]
MTRIRAALAPLRRLLAIILLLCLLPVPSPARAAVGFDVITLPPNPELQALAGGLIDNNGTVYFLAQIAGTIGVYRLIANSIEPFLLDGAQVPAQLPSGIGTSITINRAEPWFVDASGRVYFWIIEAGQSLVTRALRLEVGGGFTLLELGPPGSRFRNETATSSGRWLATEDAEVEGDSGFIVYRSDGVSSQEVLRRPSTRTSCSNGRLAAASSNESRVRINANGKGVIHEILSTLVYPNSDCSGPRPRLEQIGFRISSLNGTTQVEQQFSTTEVSALEVRSLQLNDADNLIYALLTFAPNDTWNFRLVRDGSTLLERSGSGQPSRSISATFSSALLQPDGSVVYQMAPGDDPAQPAGGLFRDSTLILAGNDPLFPAPISFSFLYRASSGGALAANYFDPTLSRARIVLLSPTLGRWINGDGGAWSDPTNWAGEEVPGQGDRALFNLANAYTVSTGTQQVGSVELQDGEVTWTAGELAIIGALRVGSRDGQGETSLSVVDRVQVGELYVGALPTSATDDETNAIVQILADGQIDVSGPLVIGQAGRAGFGLFGGKLTTGETKLGVGGVGRFATLVGGQWDSGSLLVGESYPGYISLVGGSALQSSSARIGGEPFSPNFDPAFDPSGGEGGFSQVSVSGVGFDEAINPTNSTSWSIQAGLELGSGHPGSLRISDGGSVQVAETLAVDNLAPGLPVALPPGSSTWSRVLVGGVDESLQQPATLLIGQDLLLGNTAGAVSSLRIVDGGIVDIGRSLSVGHQPGSLPIVFVEGAGATLTAGQGAGASCSIGFSGTGDFRVSDGGAFRCVGPLFIGLGDDEASLSVAGAESQTRAQRIEVGAPASAEPTGAGAIELDGGRVVADQSLTIWENGTLGGSGAIVGTLVNHGTINVGLEPLPPNGNLQTLAALGTQPGTLSIVGAATFLPDSKLRLDLVGADQYDQLTVSGAAQLDGELVLAFGEGYAPRAGDSFAFVGAGSSAGAFSTVTVTGLAPGWQFNLSSSGGVTTLRSESDAVATTTPTLQRVYLPLARR